MNFKQHPSFKKEFKRFNKKWPSMIQDLDLAKQAILAIYKKEANKIRHDFFAGTNASVLYKPSPGCEIVKMRFACRSLRTKRFLRLVFCYLDGQIILLEIFSKGDKPREDQRRIRPYIKNIKEASK